MTLAVAAALSYPAMSQTVGGLNLPQIGSIQPGVVRDGRVEAQFISEHTALRRGTTSRIGLRMKMDEHWHTYWKNPGESGLATSIAWDLPEGVTVSEIQWPAPDYLEVGGLASYIYEGQVVLPVTVTVPEGFGEPSLTLRARADWLVCREACEPGEASLSLTLPLVDSKAEPATDPRWAGLFRAATDRQPHPLGSTGTQSVHWRDDVYALAIKPGDTSGTAVEAVPHQPELRFFPDQGQVIDATADQSARVEPDGTLVFTLSPHPLSDPPVRRLTGVVTVRSGESFRAYQIDQAVRDVADGQTQERVIERDAQ